MKFFSDISIWWLIPWGILAIVIAIWYYRGQKTLSDLSSWIKTSLISLRAVSLFLIGVLLLGLLLESIEYKAEKPVFITLVDDSASMLNYKDSSEVARRIDEFRTKLETQYSEKFDVIHYSVGDGVESVDPKFRDQLSNLDEGFEQLYTQYYNQNVGGICFISDGNFNKGSDPNYSAAKIALTPIFTVGVGDTIKKRDQVIRTVAANDIAFYKNNFPVEINIQATRAGKISSNVSIFKAGKKIASEVVKYEDGKLDFAHVSIMLDASEIGFVEYTVEVEAIDNESSYENNKWTFYVEVIDSRSKILMLSHAPHPDVTALKSVIEKDENVEVKSMLASEWSGDLSEYALLIWHEPGVITNTVLAEKVKSSSIPVLYLIGNRSIPSNIRNLGIGVSLPASRGTRSDEVQVSLKGGFQLFEVSEDVQKALNYWPPVNVPFGTISTQKGSVLLSQRIGQVVKTDPVLAFTTDSRKQGIFIGEGLWKWRLAEYARTKGNKGFNELIQKSVQYLVVRKNTDALRVNMPRRFSVNDDVVINAEFYNSSLERITEPSISFVLTDEKGDKVNYEFAKGTIDYKLSLGKLKSGKYDWVARTSFDGKKYEKTGVFVVTDISLENLESSANHNLLNQMADKANGGFYRLDQTEKLLKDIGERNDIVKITSEKSSFVELIDYKWIFFLLIILLGIEWFVRRRAGSY